MQRLLPGLLLVLTAFAFTVSRSQAEELPLPELPQVSYVVDLRWDLGAGHANVQVRHSGGRFLHVTTFVYADKSVPASSRFISAFDVKARKMFTQGAWRDMEPASRMQIFRDYLRARSVSPDNVSGEPCSRYEMSFDIDRYLADAGGDVPSVLSPGEPGSDYSKFKGGGSILECVTSDGITIALGALGAYTHVATKVERRPLADAEVDPALASLE